MSPDWIYKLIRLFIICLGNLPKGWTRYLAGVIGLLWYHFDRRHRTIVVDNLGHAYGKTHTPDQITSLTKRIFKNVSGIVFNVAWAYTLKKKQVPEYFRVQGEAYLENAVNKGRGVLLLACHMGNWELMTIGISLVPHKVFGIYRRLDFEPLNRLVVEFREKHGLEMIPIRGAGKKITAILGKGGIAGTLLDQSVDWYEGVFVDFFGRRTCTNKGVAVLAMRTRAAVVPVCIFRKNDRYIMQFEPELSLQITGDRIRDIETNTQTYMTAIEGIIRRSPEHWFWMHNRWKTKPFCPWPPPGR